MSDGQSENCEQMEVESLRHALRETLAAARELYDWQNGCPLPSYEKGWGDAMKMVSEVLGKYEVKDV